MDKNNQILSQSAQFVKGVGPKKIKSLNNLNIFNVRGLLFYFPRRYEDRSNLKKINKISVGSVETIRGRVLAMGLRRLQGRKTIFQLAVGDESGVLYGTWFNQPYMKNAFKLNDEVILHGKVDRYSKLQINSPEYEVLKSDDEDTIHTGRIVPVYPLGADVYQRYLRSLLKRTLDTYLDEVIEFLPPQMLKENELCGIKQALANVHFPDDFKQLETARKRLIFDEFFLLQLAIAIRKHDMKENIAGIGFKMRGELLDKFKKTLPFELTHDQRSVIKDIEEDMRLVKPMNRLLQGDVGSGKTIVSIWALVGCVQDKYQAALMVPTEILARQHYHNIAAMLEPLGIKVVLLVSGLKKKEKEETILLIAENKAEIVIGTHSLIQDTVKWKKLGLIIVDEQHKFGVMQRVKLRKKGRAPDMLVMSATPIPRTLAITVYGDLDVSTIRQLPPGRTPVETYWISEKKRNDFYVFLKKKIKEKNQVYVVYPVVEKSKVLDLKAAVKMYEHFKRDIFPEVNVGLIHGRMKDEEKKSVMRLFKAGQIDILVATTVIEVGIDVPNASVILIEHAERFGLSQLHQLRGRVGRGRKQAYCVLLSEAKSEEAAKRLSAMTKTNDGFKIAEVDLLIRGPGEFFGTKQHGMPELKIANILSDRQILLDARKEAFALIEQNPAIKEQKDNPIISEMIAKFPQNQELISAR
ncbi:MAG: ATP-dependent DNA helicase RecG [Candidatus Omnitrophica bacterium]|nr:ATP-dependent DNA helicase RecG [Candidatus Omnitrophota bacterium]